MHRGVLRLFAVALVQLPVSWVHLFLFCISVCWLAGSLQLYLALETALMRGTKEQGFGAQHKLLYLKILLAVICFQGRKLCLIDFWDLTR